MWSGRALDICSKLHIWASLAWGGASPLSSGEVSGAPSSHRATWSHPTSLRFRFCSSKLCLTVLPAVSVAFPDQPSLGVAGALGSRMETASLGSSESPGSHGLGRVVTLLLHFPGPQRVLVAPSYIFNQI